MPNWTIPDFDSLPASVDARFRWAGHVLVDEEQYRTEGWQRTVETWRPEKGDRDVGYWRIDIAGCEAYIRLRTQRRADRKASWQARQEADDEWSDRVASLVDGGVPW